MLGQTNRLTSLRKKVWGHLILKAFYKLVSGLETNTEGFLPYFVTQKHPVTDMKFKKDYFPILFLPPQE